MYSVLKINDALACLFDSETLQPPLLSLRFVTDELLFKSYNYQRVSLTNLQYLYEYWYAKHLETLDYSVYKTDFSDAGILFLIDELDGFWHYLNDIRPYDTNLIHLPVDSAKSKSQLTHLQTNAIRYQSVCRFLFFLVNTYITSAYVDEDIKSLHSRQNALKLRLDFASKKYSKLIKSPAVNSGNYKSLTYEQVSDLMRLIRPSSITNLNPINPCISIHLQYRNYVLVKFLLGYGLRIGEALLLRNTSFQTNLAQTKFYMRVDSLDDGQDTREDRPSIKNSFSIRELEISKSDYTLMTVYYQKVRFKADHSFLFVSNSKPHNPLSYKAAYEIIATNVDSSFKKHFPQHYDKSNNIDAIKQLAPHSLRHTWAYHSLARLFEEQRIYHQKANAIDAKGIMESAKDHLRVLGGWAPNSVMPGHYARRFIAECANQILAGNWSNDLTSDLIDQVTNGV